MKKLISIISALVVMVSIFCLPTAAATQTLTVSERGRGDEYCVQRTTNGNHLFVHFTFEELSKFKNAYNIQAEAQVEAAGLPKMLMESVRENIYINGVSVGEWLELVGEQYVFMVHYETYTYTGLCLFWDPDYAPGTDVTDVIEFGIADGLITSEMYKIKPFTATWDPKESKMTVKQGFEPPSAGGETTTTTKAPSDTTKAPSDTTKAPTSTKTQSPTGGSETTTNLPIGEASTTSATDESTLTTAGDSDTVTTITEANTDPTVPVDSNEGNGSEDGNGKIIILIAVIAIVLVGAGVALFFVFRKKEN